MPIIGERMKLVRKNKSFTQKQVAEAIGITYDTYQSYELGRVTPSVERLIDFCKLFQVSSDYILGLEINK